MNRDCTALVNAQAQLLGLLRAGEQSAQVAFSRLARRLPPAAAERTRSALASIANDEARHERLLAQAATTVAVATIAPGAPVRRFFLRLESRELSVHLARVAALDSCVCQMLAAVLTPTCRVKLSADLTEALTLIRRDEGRHVKSSRELARELDLDPATQQQLDGETRHAFDAIVALYDLAFVDLGVDVDELRRRIRRHGN